MGRGGKARKARQARQLRSRECVEDLTSSVSNGECAQPGKLEITLPESGYSSAESSSDLSKPTTPDKECPTDQICNMFASIVELKSKSLPEEEESASPSQQTKKQNRPQKKERIRLQQAERVQARQQKKKERALLRQREADLLVEYEQLEKLLQIQRKRQREQAAAIGEASGDQALESRPRYTGPFSPFISPAQFSVDIARFCKEHTYQRLAMTLILLGPQYLDEIVDRAMIDRKRYRGINLAQLQNVQAVALLVLDLWHINHWNAAQLINGCVAEDKVDGREVPVPGWQKPPADRLTELFRLCADKTFERLGLVELLLGYDFLLEMFTASADDFPDFPPGRILEMQKMAKKVARYAEVVSDCAKILSYNGEDFKDRPEKPERTRILQSMAGGQFGIERAPYIREFSEYKSPAVFSADIARFCRNNTYERLAITLVLLGPHYLEEIVNTVFTDRGRYVALNDDQLSNVHRSALQVLHNWKAKGWKSAQLINNSEEMNQVDGRDLPVPGWNHSPVERLTELLRLCAEKTEERVGLIELLLGYDFVQEITDASQMDFPDFPHGRIWDIQERAMKVASYEELVNDMAEILDYEEASVDGTSDGPQLDMKLFAQITKKMTPVCRF
ncbi:hypothetical protein BV898_18880 [Hypsibius exemplaris]|uniref:Uncharacterized protein n=1 Tax=Hypsibius exemplaris TaxID=2072580 RepID=A0A9X6NKG6_HYPEX|nr:hypothetical protein BV898_18880 [Hypsibius exemplaris]